MSLNINIYAFLTLLHIYPISLFSINLITTVFSYILERI